jgi:phage terminase small subunit
VEKSWLRKKMGARGRRSNAELTLLQRAEEVVVRRPDPPDHLSDGARMEWREVVNSLPADHFSRGMHPLLEAYCRSAVAARVIDRLIQELDEREGATQADYDRLLVMHEREARALASLAVRLGIACATRGPISSPTSKPWEKLSR